MENTGYPCPGCGAPADLVVGCRTCGRPPYPPAAEVVRLDREITALAPRVDAARLAYQELAGRLSTVRQRRAELAARIRAEIPAPRPAAVPVPMPVRPGPPVAGPARPGGAETSARAVQGLLFVLGGLLLGAAAVVFTAVAWAAFGVAGRALILLAVTVLALAAPLLARARGLRGTAETIAAVGLLLVLLDGYAAWSVNLFGVAGWPGSRYAALVATGSAAVAAGYARLSRLTAPWFAAWLAAQPALPLAVAAAEPTAAGWALVLTALALGDLVVVVVLRRRATGGASRGGDAAPVAVRAGTVLGWLGYGVALALAAGCALVPLAVGRAAGTGLLAGGPLLVVASALVVGAFAAGGRVLRAAATGLLVPVLAAALVRPVAAERPGLLLVAAGLVAATLAGAVRALPSRVRTGPRFGALTVAAGLGAVATVLTGLVAAATAIAAFPAWQGGRAVPAPSWGWQLPSALLLVAAALVLLAPRAARPLVGALAAGLTAFAAPAVVDTPWPVVLVVDLAVAAALLLGAVRRPRRGPLAVAVAASTAALLTGHALLVGCAAPAGAGAVLAVTAGLGVTAAALGRRGSGAQPVVAGVALAVALLAVPAAVVVALFGLGAPPWWQSRGGTAAVVLPVIAVVAVRRRWPDLSGYASAGLAAALAGIGLGPLVTSGAEPVALYAVTAALLALAAGGGNRPPVAPRVVGVASAGLAVLAAAPAALAVLGNLPVRPWSGAPGTAVPVGAGRAGLVLVLLGVVAAGYARAARRPARVVEPARVLADPARGGAGATAVVSPAREVAGRVRAGRGAPADTRGSGWWWPALPFGAVALPVLLAAAGAPWPVVPAVAFGTGLAALLTVALAGWGALRPAGASTLASSTGSGGVPPVAAAVLLPLGAVLGGFGFAGLLATRAGTLVALGVLVLAGVVVGAAGRSVAVRLAGWLGGVSAATGFAVTAPLAAGLPLRTAAFTVLAVATLTLHAAPTLRSTPRLVDLGRVVGRERRDPGNLGATTPRSTSWGVLEGVAQAGAVLAVVLAGGALRYAAGVCVLWGLAVAVRVLRRGETPAGRTGLAVVAAGSELLGGWLLLAAGQVAVLEAYTVPAALLALGAGLLALRRRPGLTSWLALGPGLGAALLPSLVSVLAAPDPQPVRRLALGAVALGAVLGGAVRRWQAPVVLGAATLVPLALHELARGWDLLPRWIFLGLGGLLLIGLAATYERRRRDLARLRSAVARLS
ncbi:SCO7613 C-terminal domain-containing membrane protein [Micromonospora sp. NPDC051300]|uniref:SCO7613 C-terminal domain-containing membrane protein n=1 Tax=Micromonospora sp. NPDC051300 TaxID=3364286 RepID=UPI0037941EF7